MGKKNIKYIWLHIYICIYIYTRFTSPTIEIYILSSWSPLVVPRPRSRFAGLEGCGDLQRQCIDDQHRCFGQERLQFILSAWWRDKGSVCCVFVQYLDVNICVPFSFVHVYIYIRMLSLSLSHSLSLTLSPYVEISFSYQMLPACTDRQTIPIFMNNHEGMCESWWLGIHARTKGSRETYNFPQTNGIIQ